MDDPKSARRTSIETSNPNIFSDDYAVDLSESISNASPTDSIASGREQLNLDRDDNVLINTREYTPPGLPGNIIGLSQLSSSERSSPAAHPADPNRPVSISSQSIADTRRTLSTSSRFSIPRAQSPYQGPTAPSQPYGLYPQATRAESIASESTIRPQEHPFVAQGGPEHPYSMYPQNTVPEEDDNSETHIALGFPGMGQSYPPGTNSSGDDVGDIVGTDGHVEQLPPYSRYADNVIAKGDMATIDPQTNTFSPESSSASTVQPEPSSASDVELTAVGSADATNEVARKEGLKEKIRRRTCCGLPVWTVICVAAIVVVAAVLGGVIGAILGNQKGSDRAQASSATTTVWLDADPAETGPSTPACPTGHYTIPLNQTQEIDTCIVDGTYTQTWDCLDVAKLGINIFESTTGGPQLSVVFDDYSVRPQLFSYGPQPPDFNGTAFELQPYKDREDDELGVALFFSVLFDKLSILRADDLIVPDSKKRSIPASQLAKRGYDDSDYLHIGDKPWYCFWNSTINEFWVFLDQDMNNASSAESATATITSTLNTPTYYTPSPTSGPSPMYGTEATSLDPAMTTPFPSEPTDVGYWPGSKRKRDPTNMVGGSLFPKLVKMVEKRKPDNNVQPYCQQMQVLNNWQIMPIPDIPTIPIEEKEYDANGSRRMALRKRSADTVQQLGSNCICEWFSY